MSETEAQKLVIQHEQNLQAFIHSFRDGSQAARQAGSTLDDSRASLIAALAHPHPPHAGGRDESHPRWKRRVDKALEEIHDFQNEDTRKRGPKDTVARIREILVGYGPATLDANAGGSGTGDDGSGKALPGAGAPSEGGK